MTNNLDFCLALHHAHASLQRKLDDELGTCHGIGFGEFVLLAVLAAQEEGRAAMPDLARPLGLSDSALVRQLIVLEKIGLVGREGTPGQRRAVLRPAGRALVQGARETAARICDAAVPAGDASGLAAARRMMDALACTPALALA